MWRQRGFCSICIPCLTLHSCLLHNMQMFLFSCFCYRASTRPGACIILCNYSWRNIGKLADIFFFLAQSNKWDGRVREKDANTIIRIVSASSKYRCGESNGGWLNPVIVIYFSITHNCCELEFLSSTGFNFTARGKMKIRIPFALLDIYSLFYYILI